MKYKFFLSRWSEAQWDEQVYRPLTALLEDGQHRGEVRSDIPPSQLADLCGSGVVYIPFDAAEGGEPGVVVMDQSPNRPSAWGCGPAEGQSEPYSHLFVALPSTTEKRPLNRDANIPGTGGPTGLVTTRIASGAPLTSAYAKPCGLSAESVLRMREHLRSTTADHYRGRMLLE